MYTVDISKTVLYKWRLFRFPNIADPDNVVLFTKAAIALHNYLRFEDAATYCPTGFVDGDDSNGNITTGVWRDEQPRTGMQPIHSVGW